MPKTSVPIKWEDHAVRAAKYIVKRSRALFLRDVPENLIVKAFKNCAKREQASRHLKRRWYSLHRKFTITAFKDRFSVSLNKYIGGALRIFLHVFYLFFTSLHFNKHKAM